MCTYVAAKKNRPESIGAVGFCKPQLAIHERGSGFSGLRAAVDELELHEGTVGHLISGSFPYLMTYVPLS
jgi:hypothetical protein